MVEHLARKVIGFSEIFNANRIIFKKLLRFPQLGTNIVDNFALFTNHSKFYAQIDFAGIVLFLLLDELWPASIFNFCAEFWRDR
jgi:hypothetical protein